MATAPTYVPPLLAGLVDDAGLFPPTQLPMADAVARHRSDEAAGHRMLTHRFLCPASRLGELRGQLATTDCFRLGLIVDTGLDGLSTAIAEASADDRLALDLVEVPLAEGDQPRLACEALETLTALPLGVSAYLEPRRGADWLAAVREVAARDTTRRGAKVRCGGVRAELFPSAEELAAFVSACVREGVPFKATAGLHHAVRYTDAETGFDHHGFLNLLVATGLAAQGAGDADLVAALLSVDGVTLAGQARQLDATVARQARELLVSYGSCSTSEPIDDVTALGLIHETEAQ